MANWSVISKTEHLNAGWTRYSDYGYAQQDATVPVVGAEITHLLPYYAMGFVKTQQGYQLVAILSLQADVNLYVNQQGQWLAPYVPSFYRSYPFAIMQGEDGADYLCADQNSELFSQNAEPEQARIFDAEGVFSERMKEVEYFLQQRLNNQHATDILVNQLAQYELITPWRIELKIEEDGNAHQVNGLFRIDEAALKTLSPEQASELLSSGALGIAYAQLFSQNHIKDFSTRFAYYAQQENAGNALEVDLDKLFGDDDDNFKF